MGSPKEPQRLQLTRPDGASENISLRSPISSRIWQAEDPTSNSGFDGEDLCMRNFCVSVHGDHELMEGSFSFDIDRDDILEVHRDFSVGADGTYSFHEVREDQSVSKQGDLNFRSDAPQTETLSKQSHEESTHSASLSDGKGTDLSNSENLDSTGQITNAPSVSDESLSLRMNANTVSNDYNVQGETLEREKKNVNGKSESIQLASSLGNQESEKVVAEAMAENEEVTNGETKNKTCASNLLPLGSDMEEKQYRSIAISPIVPPDGSSSFTFQTGITPFAKNSSGKDSTGRNDDVPKTYSCEANLAEGEAESKYRSVAVSPIIPPGESSLFPFQKDQPQENIKGCCLNTTSYAIRQEKLNDESETKVEYKSVAVSPIIPPEGSSSFTFHALRTASGTGKQEAESKELLPKTYSYELTPPNHDACTQVDNRAECVSVAVSPIVPPDGSSSFIFQSDLVNRIGGEKVPDNDNTQGSTRVQYVSVAISPIVLPGGSSSFTFIAENNATEPNKDLNVKTADNLPKTYSFELTPPDDEPGTSSRVEFRSVAVSPIIPPDEVSFSFQTDTKKESSFVDAQPKMCSIELTPFNQDVGTQADNKVECVSVAVSPIVIPQGSSSFSFQGEQIALHHDQTQKLDSCIVSTLPKTSLESTTLYHDIGIQVDTTVQCASIAVSPMVPLQGSCSFVFQEDATPASTLYVQEKPEMKDAEMQVSFSVETRSIATDPMTPKGKSPQASYPEVKVKEAKADHPEPVREVSWDEKGMTWEVYGASMEVEVLGMAIQKHLEKQIEEHGRQKVMTPQNTARASSIRGPVVKNESKKRQPGTFRTFFQRRPRCCSRAGQTAE